MGWGFLGNWEIYIPNHFLIVLSQMGCGFFGKLRNMYFKSFHNNIKPDGLGFLAKFGILEMDWARFIYKYKILL